MLRPRIIPCLLIQGGGLVKTVKFKDPKYIGDPLNAVRIFNEKEVDELIVLDIDATRLGNSPNENLIENLAAECRMPLCYGGGINNIDQIERLISLGVEKVAVSSAIIETPALISEAAARVGSQSIVSIIDIKNTGLFKRPEVVIHNAMQRTGLDPIEFACNLEQLGVGEIVINSVDQDGTMLGYDFELIDSFKKVVSVPLTALGGAGSFNDLRQLVQEYPVIGAAAGSLFVFKGKYRAVLINYPNRSDRDSLVS